MPFMTRFAAALVAACALIGQAQADPTYTVIQAMDNFILAYWAAANCPGIKVNEPKIEAQLLAAGVRTEFKDLASFEKAHKQEEREVGKVLGIVDGTTIIPNVAVLCMSARDPLYAFHFLLDIEN
jgi:hypothetical protein